MRLLVVSLGLTACTFSTRAAPDDAAPGDAAGDAAADARPLDGCTTFSTIVDSCALGAYGAGISISALRRYDTDTHELSDDNGANASTPTFREVTIGGNPITLIVTDAFTLQGGARLRVTGSRAFGVVASG